VEPCHRRQPGQLGVRHPLRREHKGRDDVLANHSVLVRPDQRDAGHVRPPPSRRDIQLGLSHQREPNVLEDVRAGGQSQAVRTVHETAERASLFVAITVFGFAAWKSDA
jgi:hypothetical protein